MCSSANPTEVSLQQSQAAFTNTLDTSFKTTFANQQQILGTLSSTLQKAILNPQGFTPAEMVALRTGATATTAQQTENAQKAAAAYGASHGGADLGSGVQSEIQGEIATGGAQQTATEQNQITVADAQQRQQNYWNAIQGLTNVGNAYNPNGYAANATGAANSVTSASNAITSEEQAGWQDAFGVVSGVAGLATAAAGMPFGGGPTSSIGNVLFSAAGGGAGPGNPGGAPVSLANTPNVIQ
jgi:hypothetical protein